MSIAPLFDKVDYGCTKRFDCPYCNGKHTLSITKDAGNVMYYCFKNSCMLHTGGSRILKMTERELISKLASGSALEGRTEAFKEFRLPTYCTMGIPSKSAFQMLLNGNAIESYTDGKFRVAYDPKQDRLCFLVLEDGKIVGAVGKALNTKTKPKVYNYPNSKNIPFTCGKGETVVIVEDCLSACSVGRIQGYTGLALLGTYLKHEYLAYIISTYTNVIIALDPDAYAKSINMRGSIQYYTQNVKIWKLEHELKNMNKTQILKFIEESNTPIIK